MDDERSISSFGATTITSTEMIAPFASFDGGPCVSSFTGCAFGSTALKSRRSLRDLLPGSGNNSVNGGNDSSSQLSDSGDEAIRRRQFDRTRSAVAKGTWGRNRQKARYDLRCTVESDSKKSSGCSDDGEVGMLMKKSISNSVINEQKGFYRHSTSSSHDDEIVGNKLIIRTSSLDMLPLGPRSVEDAASTLAHAPESVAGDIDNRSLSSLPASAGNQTHLDNDILIHVEYAGHDRSHHQFSSIQSFGSIGSVSIGDRDRDIDGVDYNYRTRNRSESAHGSGACGGFRTIRALGNHHTGLKKHLMEEETRFPSALSCATSDAAKSDSATVCSGSIIEDIEISSVFSNELGSTHQPLARQTPQVGSDRTIIRKSSFGSSQKHDRSVEFSLHSLTDPSYPTSVQPNSNTSTSPPIQSYFRSNFGVALNAMGPPLNRTVLLPPAGVCDGQGSLEAGGPSRSGSVRSFASDNVFVDTDDCGGSFVESEGRGSLVDEHQSVNSHDDGVTHCCDAGTALCNAGLSDLHHLDVSNNMIPPTDLGQLQNLISVQGINGRVSPGGTIYKGRGVRRYQGRYMHLPLKRFHQSSMPHDTYSLEVSDPSNALEQTLSRRNSPNRRDEWSERRSWSRSRSRSRSRERGENDGPGRNSWTRSRSRSPTSNVRKPNGFSSGGRRRKGGNRSHAIRRGDNSGRWTRSDVDFRDPRVPSRSDRRNRT